MKRTKLAAIGAMVLGLAACQSTAPKPIDMKAACEHIRRQYPTPNMTITMPDNHDWPCWDHGGNESFFAEMRDRTALAHWAESSADNLGTDVISMPNH